MEVASKVCRKCGVNHPLTHYYAMASAPDGLKYQCKDCQHEYWAAHQRKHRAARKALKVAKKPIPKPIKPEDREPKGWPLPAPPELSEQLLTYQLRKSWGGVTRGPLFAAVL